MINWLGLDHLYVIKTEFDDKKQLFKIFTELVDDKIIAQYARSFN